MIIPLLIYYMAHVGTITWAPAAVNVAAAGGSVVEAGIHGAAMSTQFEEGE